MKTGRIANYSTPFGVLAVPYDIDQDKVYAEIRGLGLLKDIINSSGNWFHEIDYDMEPVVCSNDGKPEIKINIFTSVKNRLVNNDGHISIQMGEEYICVLRNPDTKADIPASDAIVSMVLLGNSDWPIDKTPSTLEEKSLAHFHREKGITKKELKLTRKDYIDLQMGATMCRQEPRLGLSKICEVMRGLYCNKMMDFEDIFTVTKEFVDHYNDKKISDYCENPHCSQDVLFLEMFLRDRQLSSAFAL